MRHILLALIMGLLGIFTVEAQDADFVANDPPYPCPYTNGAFYQPNLFPRFDINSQSLVLVDAATNQTVRVLDTFDENVRIINWSPDCRYLSGVVGSIRFGPTESQNGYFVDWYYKNLVLWDAVSSGRLWSITSPQRYVDYVHQGGILWSPDSNYALILGGCGALRSGCIHERTRYDFIWQRSTNNGVRVGQLPEPRSVTGSNGEIQFYFYEHVNVSRSWFNQVYWDTKRGWLWGSGAGGVSAYDVNTGAEVRFFLNASWTEAKFVFSSDNTKVVVYSIAQPGSRGEAAITLYDIDSQNGVSVNVEGLAAPEIPLASYHPVALSADNRYLVVGHEALRVWDIQNLPENVADRLPIYRHGGPQALIQSVRFWDWGVIETTSTEGVQHWDLHTGEYVP